MSSRSEPTPSMPLSDIGNECWNERSEIRTEVLGRLKAVLREKIGREQVPPAFWAFCQVADVSKLERMIAIAESTQDTEIAELLLEPTIKDCDSVVARWLQNISVSKSTTSGTSHSERSNTASRNCKKRDNNKCVLTGLADPDAAHIYPYCLLKASTREPTAVGRFWDIMKMFWEESRVQKWRKEIFGNEQNLQNPQDRCFNMLSLNKHPHALWGAGRFALRPMEKPDPKTLKVQFYWQRKSSNGVTELDLLTEPESTRGLYGDREYSFSVPTGTFKSNGEPEYKAVVSGDAFILTTHDPEGLPLPSWSLLEMQWHLQRIAAMSGAAEVRDYSNPDDDFDAEGTIDRDATIRRVKDIFEWLQILPDSDESAFRQSPTQAYHVMWPLGSEVNMRS